VLQTVLTLSLCVAVLVRAASAQQPAIQYAYDELGQLVAVVDQDGNAAIYVYDAVGNILSIQRVDPASLPGRVAITAVIPAKGKAGTVVSILGKGFGASAGQNAVSFNGAAAIVGQAAPNRIITTVPTSATTGPITVTAPLGTAVSPQPFRVVGIIVLSPTAVSLGPSGTQQFVATDGDVETTYVIWAANGVIGGDPTVGTISPQGLYVAPSTIANPRTVTVTATSKDDVAVVGTATVTLRPPIPAFLAAAPVGIQFTDPGVRILAAATVGVQRAADSAGFAVVAPAIGVSPPMAAAFSGISQISVSLAPLITSISPATAPRGSTNLALTMTGSALAGVISLDFLLNSAPDGAITVTNLTATTDGTQATAQISIAASASPGPRVVRLRASAGTTTSVGAGGNVFTVQ
jgi:YD repeat-containing protein